VDYEAAKDLFQESMKRCQEIGDRWGTTLCLLNLGYIAIKQNEPSPAKTLEQESFSHFSELDDKTGIIYSLVGIAAAESGLGNFSEATQLLAVAENMREQIHLELQSDALGIYENTVTEICAKISAPKYLKLWQSGEKKSLDEIVKSFTSN
jgi:hypothetical protein